LRRCSTSSLNTPKSSSPGGPATASLRTPNEPNRRRMPPLPRGERGPLRNAGVGQFLVAEMGQFPVAVDTLDAARACHRPKHEALALELAARLSRDGRGQAETRLRSDAAAAYERWGALAKAEQLRKAGP